MLVVVVVLVGCCLLLVVVVVVVVVFIFNFCRFYNSGKFCGASAFSHRFLQCQ